METRIKINDKKGWLFAFQTNLLTYSTVLVSFRFDIIESLFKNGCPISVYVTDCLASQLKTFAKVHKICMVHLLRGLNILWVFTNLAKLAS